MPISALNGGDDGATLYVDRETVGVGAMEVLASLALLSPPVHFI